MHTCCFVIFAMGDGLLFSLFISAIDIEVFCYSYEGIDAVKSALKAGLAQSTEDMPVKVR